MIKLNYRKTMLILSMAMFFTIAVLAAIFFRIENDKNYQFIARMLTAQMDEAAFVLTDSLEKSNVSSCIAYLDRQVIANDALESLTLVRDGKFMFSTDRGRSIKTLMSDVGVSDISVRHILTKEFITNVGGETSRFMLVARFNDKMFRSVQSQLLADTIIFGFGATVLLMLIQFSVIYFFYISSFKKFYVSVMNKNFNGKYHVREFDTLQRIFSDMYNSLNTTNRSLKKNLAELTYSRNLFQTLFNSLPVPVFFKDREGKYQRVNQQFLDTHGFNSEEEVIGLTVADIMDAHKAEECRISDREVIEHPEKQIVMESEIYISRKDKHCVIIFYKAAVFGEDGSVNGLVSVMMDVTEERSLEKLKNSYAEQLEKEQRRLNQMFQSHSAVMLIVNPENGRIMQANEASVSFYGYSLEELTSMNISDLNLMSYEEMRSTLKCAKDSVKNYFEYRHMCKDGTMKDVEIHSSPVEANGEIFLYVVIHDITLKKRHELISKMQLAISSAFLNDTEEKIFAAANSVILKGFGAQFGYLGYIDQDGSLVSPALTSEIFEKCKVPNKTMVAHCSSWGGIWGQSLREKRIIIKNADMVVPEGHVVLRNAMAVPIVYNDNLLGQFAVADISGDFGEAQKEIADNIAGLIAPVLMHWRRNKYHEENLLNEKHDLELAVEKEMELKKRGEQILFEQKKFADMGQMINAIAHQWRQPLNALGLLIQDLPESYDDGDINIKYINDYVANGVKLISHMSETIDHFRDFFMPEKEKGCFEAIVEIISLFRLINIQLKSKNIDIRITCKCNMTDMACTGIDDFPGCVHHQTRVFGYVGEFKQSILNLIYNSVDAVKSREETEKGFKGRVVLAVLADNGRLTITVTDNGGGMPAEILDKIFDPYFTTKPQGKGTGIGLYMTRLIIEQHMEGRITAENIEGGAKLEIVLPICNKKD